MSQIIGYCAAVLTTLSFLPQALKTIKEKKTESISLTMYLMFTMGVFLWLLYGAVNSDIPLLVANIITFAFALTILLLKIKYK